ncbi:thiamine pyrophosphate-binding protein, partial [Phytohabitans suffuscus]
MNVASAVGQALVDHGARDVFGVVGSGNFHVTNALVAAGARFHAAAHEGGAASMADGYARVAGRLGVLTVHQGPGVTNALTGIAEAAKSRTPLVVLAPEATGPHSNFHLDLPALAGSVGAGFQRVAAPSVYADVARAATAGRTVVLGLPLDTQSQPAGPPSAPAPAPAGPAPDVAALVAALAAAR